MSETERTVITEVRPGDQAIVITLLAQNDGGADLLDSQLELALNMAKNVVQMTGASVHASGSVLSFPTWDGAARTRLELAATIKEPDSSSSAEVAETISDDTASAEV